MSHQEILKSTSICAKKMEFWTKDPVHVATKFKKKAWMSAGKLPLFKVVQRCTDSTFGKISNVSHAQEGQEKTTHLMSALLE
jgi:hypothetical protein